MSGVRLVILLFITVSTELVYSEITCKDCVNYKSCPGALHLAMYKQTSAVELFRASHCGSVYDDEENDYVTMVCCSMFPVPDPIEAHPNRELLPESCGDIDGDRIIGGTIAGLYEFPWMTLISFSTVQGLQFGCGGSVINSKYILTAAHCAFGKKIAGVRIGDHNIYHKTDCLGEHTNRRCESRYQDIRVAEVLSHPNYTKYEGDIALLRLTKNIDLTLKNARPICLPVTVDLRQVNITGQTATVAGWGTTDSGFTSPILQKVNIPILPRSECKFARSHPPGYDKEFCAGTAGRDSCDGDSGGPLILQKVYNGVLRYVQYGIVSYGSRDCGTTNGGIYVDVSKYMGWILDTITP